MEEAGTVPGGGVVELFWLEEVLAPAEAKVMPERPEVMPPTEGLCCWMCW